MSPSSKALKLDQSSELYGILCNLSSSTGVEGCNYLVEVTLVYNIPCTGQECFVDTARLVEVNNGIYYEYVRQACVELSFYSNAQSIINGWEQKSMCANPKSITASEACCNSIIDAFADSKNCRYAEERMTCR